MLRVNDQQYEQLVLGFANLTQSHFTRATTVKNPQHLLFWIYEELYIFSTILV
jgi:hypothetical protein